VSRKIAFISVFASISHVVVTKVLNWGRSISIAPPSPEQGLRPVEIWVLDTRSPAFADQARRQSAAVAASEYAQDDQAFVDAISAEWP
jgi:hypothetical protein